MQAYNTATYIDVLDRLVFSYNNTLHSMLGMTPQEALSSWKTSWKFA